MKIPLTNYGWPQMFFYPAGIIIFMIFLYFGASPSIPSWLVQLVEIALGIIVIWSLSFFRDPEREIPRNKNILLAPADGTVKDIETIDEPAFIGGKAIRVGIFLSIFDVHINRSPCKVKVEKIMYREGKFLDARNIQAGHENESNELWLTSIEPPNLKLIVRQISGAIARRIVCKTAEGAQLVGGERFGMIKFGSRTELYAPDGDNIKCLVKIGDKVKAGITPIIKV